MSREGKIHLVESCSFPRETYKNVTNDEKFKALKEAAVNVHGKSRLNEASVFNNLKKTLVESKIDEAIQERVLKGLQEAGANVDDVELWQFPISKINTKEHPNLNGRVYNRQLWENVINKQTDVWKCGTGLANHPADDEDGDFMKQAIVWLDGFIGDDDIIYGIGTFVGEGGALARQIIGVGGRVGFSSSGFGDFLSDGITVEPEGYEIDRLADLVLNPSQGVYGDYNDTMKKTEAKLKESVNKAILESEDAEDEVTENETEEQEDEEDITLSEELVLNHYLESIKSISKEPNTLWEAKVSKLNDMVKKLKKENLARSSKMKLNKQIEESIESIMKDARKAIQEGYVARKICEDFGVTDISKLKNLKEQIEDFTSLEECLSQTAKEAKKYKELYESKESYAQAEAESSYEATLQVESLTKANTSLKKSLTEANKSVKTLKNSLKENKSEVAKLREIRNELMESKKSLLAQNRKLAERNAKLKDLLDEADKTVQALRRENKVTNTTISTLRESNKTLQGKLQNTVARNRSLVTDLNVANTNRKQLESKIAKDRQVARTQAKIEQAIKARKARMEEEALYDEEAMFEDREGITKFLSENGVKNNRSYKGLSTVQEAENQLLFSSELLDEEAELERENLRTPKDVPTSLADMFN